MAKLGSIGNEILRFWSDPPPGLSHLLEADAYG